jgi:hypothetical protein
MLKLLMMMGLMKRRGLFGRRAGRVGHAGMVAPFGGGLPLIAYLAYRNRDQIKAAYQKFVAPRIGKQSPSMAH